MGILHLAFNMMAFHSFAPLLMNGRNSVYTPLLSTGEFFTFYTVAGLAGSVASAAFFRRIGNYTPSLGASGSIFGIATFFCLLYPNAGLTVMFVIPMTAKTGLLVGTAANLYLVGRAIYASRAAGRAAGPMIDGMAHLGGQVVGFLWFHKRRAEEMMNIKQGSSPPPTAGRSGGIDI